MYRKNVRFYKDKSKNYDCEIQLTQELLIMLKFVLTLVNLIKNQI